ncbi:hypothetical protein [Loigolactobacillus backii]|uniref:hypothetical protein n=1 Tax=Loigolactobacillus backii TaxID=375175 RepID=UPI0007F0B703|nr:hypothetical protein [Loigolactobacillus backii]ANK60030.1 hypothetical protein AYR52_06985 [Loigolactobacillus backii]ANK66589.1 hypothetical protein AYR55_02095 [Loigolactobacillus backii]OLF70811.1 hypothetical protein ACX53_00360 [Loigolactobacillus backii]PIO87299.1 hypothetical protein B8A32_09240 [Loigolactobacillus backii]
MKPTDTNTVAEITAWLDAHSIDHTGKTAKADLLALATANNATSSAASAATSSAADSSAASSSAK